MEKKISTWFNHEACTGVSAPVQIRDENQLFFAGRDSPDLVGRLLEERKKIFGQFESVIDAVLPGDDLPEVEKAAALGAPELLFRYGKHFAKSTKRWIDQEEERVMSALRDDQGGSDNTDDTREPSGPDIVDGPDQTAAHRDPDETGKPGQTS